MQVLRLLVLQELPLEPPHPHGSHEAEDSLPGRQLQAALPAEGTLQSSHSVASSQPRREGEEPTDRGKQVDGNELREHRFPVESNAFEMKIFFFLVSIKISHEQKFFNEFFSPAAVDLFSNVLNIRMAVMFDSCFKIRVIDQSQEIDVSVSFGQSNS